MMESLHFTVGEIDPDGRRETTRHLPNLGITVTPAGRSWALIVRFDNGLFPIVMGGDRIGSLRTRQGAVTAAILALDEYVPNWQEPNFYPPYQEFGKAVINALEQVDNPFELIQTIRELPDKLPQVFLESHHITNSKDRYEYGWREWGFCLREAMIELFDCDDNTFRLGKMHEALRRVFKKIPRQARLGDPQTIA